VVQDKVLAQDESDAKKQFLLACLVGCLFVYLFDPAPKKNGPSEELFHHDNASGPSTIRSAQEQSSTTGLSRCPIFKEYCH